jgi:eukaryotic-like serine/threonine-protein kinase
MHRCLDEEQVVRIVAGLVPAAEAAQLVAEVETCSTCRGLLMEAGVAMQQPADAADFAVFRPGELVAGRYTIARFVGRGGMGEVFEVFDTQLQTRAALKTIRAELSDDPNVVTRFKQELHLARRVVHPQVARVFDSGVTVTRDGAPVYFQTMEFVEGQPLSQWRKQRAVSIAVGLSIARQLAAGLSAIHAQAIDFKPDNILVRDGVDADVQVVVLDFGIARSRDRVAGLATTAHGVRMGTPDYMAPEVLRADVASFASDVFSFGLVVYELLTGRHPCANPGLRAALGALGELRVKPPELVRSDIPPGLSHVLLCCLNNAPSARPESGAALLSLLEQLTTSAQPPLAARSCSD